MDQNLLMTKLTADARTIAEIALQWQAKGSSGPNPCMEIARKYLEILQQMDWLETRIENQHLEPPAARETPLPLDWPPAIKSLFEKSLHSAKEK